MIYVDTSVVLAELFSEDRHPSAEFWSESLVSSRLLEYEVWASVNSRGLARTHGDGARALIGRLALLELAAPVLSRALEAFPRPVRTLDALHLASADFLRQRQVDVELATYDVRVADAAKAMGLAVRSAF